MTVSNKSAFEKCQKRLKRSSNIRYTRCLSVKIFLKVTKRSNSRIESVPVKKLEKANSLRKHRWEFKDGWLILEAF